MPDPDSIKQNNEVAKAQLKKRLVTNHSPGPGEYDPLKKPPIGNQSPLGVSESGLDLKKIGGKDRSLLQRLGLQDNLLGKKGLAFNSTSPRFQN